MVVQFIIDRHLDADQRQALLPQEAVTRDCSISGTTSAQKPGRRWNLR